MGDPRQSYEITAKVGGGREGGRMCVAKQGSAWRSDAQRWLPAVGCRVARRAAASRLSRQPTPHARTALLGLQGQERKKRTYGAASAGSAAHPPAAPTSFRQPSAAMLAAMLALGQQQPYGGPAGDGGAVSLGAGDIVGHMVRSMPADSPMAAAVAAMAAAAAENDQMQAANGQMQAANGQMQAAPLAAQPPAAMGVDGAAGQGDERSRTPLDGLAAAIAAVVEAEGEAAYGAAAAAAAAAAEDNAAARGGLAMEQDPAPAALSAAIMAATAATTATEVGGDAASPAQAAANGAAAAASAAAAQQQQAAQQAAQQQVLVAHMLQSHMAAAAGAAAAPSAAAAAAQRLASQGLPLLLEMLR